MVESRAPVFVVMSTLSTFLAFTIVSLRIGYRAAKKSLITADYLIIVAMFFSLCHYAFDMSLVAYFGYGRHQVDIPPDELHSSNYFIILYVLDIIVKACLAFPKLSLCFIYKNLLAGADGRLVRISQVLNYMTLVVIICYYIAAALVAAFQCNPIARAWNVKLAGTCVDDTNTVSTVTAAINLLTSVLLIYIPLPILFKSRKLKSGAVRIEISQLIALILLGLIDTGMTATRFFTAFILRGVTGDYSYTVPPLYIIIILEYNVLIIAASLVVMRNCFQAMHRLLFPHSSSWLSSMGGSSSGTRKTTRDFNSSGDSGSHDHHGQSRSYNPVPSAAGSTNTTTADVSSDPRPPSPRERGGGGGGAKIQGARGGGGRNGIFKTVDVNRVEARSISMEEIIPKEDREMC